MSESNRLTSLDFISICSEYEGNLSENEHKIAFEAKNELGRKKILCKMEFDKNRGILSGYEATYETIGGFRYLKADSSDLRRELGRYRFAKK